MNSVLRWLEPTVTPVVMLLAALAFIVPPSVQAQDSVPVKVYPRADQVGSWGEWRCNAEFQERCEGFQDFVVPSGYEACTITCDKVHKGKEAEISFTPIQLFGADTPKRFLGYRGRIYASGGRSIFDRFGSDMVIDNIILWGIPQGLSNTERTSRGCDMGRGRSCFPP